MACAAVCSSSHCAVGSRIRTSTDFFSGKRDVSLNKVVSIRRTPVIGAALRSSSEASTGFNGRSYNSNACIDQPCAINCPVNYTDSSTFNVERWVEESVHEIVKNIQEAPFLQYVFDCKIRFQGKSKRQKITQELFQNPNYWPSVRESWSKVDPPDGVILVQKLEPGGAANTCCLAEGLKPSTGDEAEIVNCRRLQEGEGAETNVWGVLVQARGFNAANSACYLLKTTRVSSPAGACTRYCLTRATCFGPSYVEQLHNAWLL